MWTHRRTLTAALAVLVLAAAPTACVLHDDEPEEEEDVHVVEEGETIFSIAQQHDVSVDAILDANPEIDDHRDIEVGHQIRIPAADREDPADRDDRLQPVTRVEGRMTDEGVTCPAMRGEDDTLYTLIGHDGLDDLEPGDRIYVEGTEPEASICQQGTTLQVTHLERR